MMIKNYNDLATTPERENALGILEAGLKVDPASLIYDTVKFNPEFKSNGVRYCLLNFDTNFTFIS